MSHTPLPWAARGRYVGTANSMASVAECIDQNGNWTNEPRALANAALIVRAVNAHDELVAALKNTRSALADVRLNGAGARLLTLDIEAIDAALAKAEAA